MHGMKNIKDVGVLWEDRSCQLLDPEMESLQSEISLHVTKIIYPPQMTLKLDICPVLMLS
jgi:hypothetical protein